MPDLPHVLMVCAAFFVGANALRFILVLHNVLRVRLEVPARRQVADAEVPPHVRAGLRPAIDRLKAVGFEWVGFGEGLRAAVYEDGSYFFGWLCHPQALAWAEVKFNEPPDAHSLHAVVFRTFAEGGRSLQTINGARHAWVGEPPGEDVHDPYAASLEEQWQAHQAEVGRRGLRPERLEASQAFARAAASNAAELEGPILRGRLVPVGDGVFVPCWAEAVRAAFTVIRASRKVQRLQAERAAWFKRQGLPPPVPPVEEEVASYRRLEELARRPARRSFLAAIFVVTAAIFGVSMAVGSGAAIPAATLFGVVLFHELGHYFAMRAFGYRDTTIFFVPFLGGAASGRKPDATLGQEMIVLLAGPLPGLIVAAAAALLGAARVPSLHFALWSLVGINLFNLLPILPLDGGRIAHALLFARIGWLDVAFRVFGVCAFALFALRSFDVVLLVVTLVLILGIPQGFRLARLRKCFAAETAGLAPEARPAACFRMLREGAAGPLPFVKKLALARAVLGQATHNASPPAGARVVWLGAYGGAFAAGLFAVVTLFAGSSPAAAEAGAARPSRQIAALSCPADFRPSGAPAIRAAGERPAGLGALGVFESPEAAAAALQTIAAADVRAAALGQVLFLGAVVPDLGLAKEEDDEEDADDPKATPRAEADARSEALRVAFRTAFKAAQAKRRETNARVRGQVEAGRGTHLEVRQRLGLECRAGDEPTARRLVDELADQFHAGIRVGAPPPWLVPPTEAQQRARRTYRIAQAATVPTKGQWRWELVRLAAKGLAGQHEDAEQFRARQISQVKAAIDAARADGAIDEEVVSLFLAVYSATSGPARQEAMRALEQRLGGRRSEEARWPLGAEVVRDGAKVGVELFLPQLGSIEAEVPALVGWLCSRGCAGPVLTLAEGSPAPERAGLGAD